MSLQPDFIIMINNDTVICQPDFLKQLFELYADSPFDILGPDIETLDHQHQNPKAQRGFSLEAVNQKIHLTFRDLWLNKTTLYQLLILADRIKRQPAKSSLVSVPTANIPPAAENVVLHGSCLVFSPRYIQKYRGLFSGTFLYCEEEILWYIAQCEQLKIIYQPQLAIVHKEDRSTRASHKSQRKRRIFKLNHELDSLRQLQAMMLNPEIYKSDMIEASV